MADGLRSMRWRAAFGFIGVGLVFAWVRMSGGMTHLIQIDYAWGGELLDGARVEIDGKVVGTLQPYGPGAPRVTGFEVEPGTHVVRVLRRGCESVPDTVELGGEHGRRATFMAEVDDGFRCVVFLR